MDTALKRRRLALFTFFFLPGLAMASWVTRTPDIRDGLGASIAEMGLVLFGLSIGSMTGILGSGWAVKRFGTRSVAFVGLALVVAALVAIGLGVVLAQWLIVAFGLLLFGLGMGISEIAINVDGADFERVTGSHLLHALHGFFSLGTVFGALLGIGFNLVQFPVAWHLAAVAAVTLVFLVQQVKHMQPGLGMTDGETAARSSESAPPVWLDIRLYAIGLIVLGMALAEGAANDWLPLLMVDEYGFNPTSGSLVFLGFAAAMTLGRFAGGYFLARFGRATVIFASAVIGAAGLAIVIFAQNPILAGVAVVLWGLGASLGFPVAISAAGDSGPRPEDRVRIVAICGYIAFLVGPPLLGFVGETHGLRNAMIVVLTCVLIAAVASLSIRKRAHT